MRYDQMNLVQRAKVAKEKRPSLIRCVEWPHVPKGGNCWYCAVLDCVATHLGGTHVRHISRLASETKMSRGNSFSVCRELQRLKQERADG